jgi:hypothetical protein
MLLHCQRGHSLGFHWKDIALPQRGAIFFCHEKKPRILLRGFLSTPGKGGHHLVMTVLYQTKRVTQMGGIIFVMSDITNTNDTSTSSGVEPIPVPYSELDLAQRTYIDWKALGGVMTDGDRVYKITLRELGEQMNIPVQTFMSAKDRVPNLWDHINERRKILSSGERLNRMHQRFYVEALKMKDWRITQAWLANFDKSFRSPTQKVEHEVKHSWADLVRRRQAAKREAIDGTVISTDSTARLGAVVESNESAGAGHSTGGGDPIIQPTLQ